VRVLSAVNLWLFNETRYRSASQAASFAFSQAAGFGFGLSNAYFILSKLPPRVLASPMRNRAAIAIDSLKS
jgi:hypothetical protein